MQRFFVEPHQIDRDRHEIHITGNDVNHIANVLRMKKGAYYITSGILDVKEDVVVQAVKDAGLTLVEVTHQGEWVSVTARKD